MNKRVFVVLMLMLLVFGITACKKNVESADIVESANTVEPTAVAEKKDNTENVTVPGVEINDENIEDMAWDETESTTDPKAETISTTPTAPAENDDADGVVEETDPTEFSDETPADTKPADGGAEKQLTEYEKYNAMSGDEQLAYMQTFNSVEAFFTWYNNAKAEYEAANSSVEIGSGAIDIGEIIGK